MGASELTFGTWRKSTFSGANSDCVEVAHAASVVGVRDSKSPDAGTLTVPAAAWTAFLVRTARVAGRVERA